MDVAINEKIDREKKVRSRGVMKPLLHLVQFSQIPILQQLQWEEALLRTDEGNWCILNQGSPPAIVLGISGQPERFIRKEKFDKAPIPLIRRFSGGGTVVVDNDTLFITLICQTEALAVHPFPRSIMEWTAQEIYSPLFSKKLFEKEFKESSGSFSLQANDYAIGNRKWGGNGQSFIKGRWLHHSSLLWDFSPEMMDYLSLPSAMPSYREGRSHSDFLCRLRDYFLHPAQFFGGVLEQMHRHFTVIEKTKEDLDLIAMRPHRKGTLLIPAEVPALNYLT